MKKRFLMFLAVLFVVGLMFAPLMAQDTEGDAVDPAVAEGIVAGVGGVISVIALTQLIKEKLKATGALAYVISAVVSAIATIVYLVGTSKFTVPLFIGYTVLVFAIANGWYKAKH